ncbi:CoA transferase [Rhodobacteraceae bacterium RKSG542]|uniref:CaiB/BaiF CoA transferase family protein n=1 Tax=Pseudovibrio flavus TaxID=2529854 RepID=UPI0012BB715F|nr:CoA transferase [Pseudovibrio flavus]MTI15907.1 CoA transferase [Pseudovibrio flavus]
MFVPNNKPGPLSGVTVLDLTLAMAGPLATSRMGDLGANVLKVESPSGDFSRLWPIAGYVHGGESSAFLTINRNKRGMVIDLKADEGRELLYKLVETADVLVQNFRPGVEKRLAIDFDTLKKINPKLVYISISGYGDEGPMVARPGQDLLVQCFSGLTFNGGARNQKPSTSPIYIIDTCASHLAVEAALSGYIEAMKTGKGQHMKVSLLSAALEIQVQEISTYLTSGNIAKQSDIDAVSTWMEPPYNIYRTQDSWIAIAHATFPSVAEAFDRPELIEIGAARPDIASGEPYLKWRDQVFAIAREEFEKNTTEFWLEKMTALGIWVGPVNDYETIKTHPQFKDLFTLVEGHKGGTYTTLAPAIRFDNTPAIRPAPGLGEHTDEILAEYGYDAQSISTLREKQIVK